MFIQLYRRVLSPQKREKIYNLFLGRLLFLFRMGASIMRSKLMYLLSLFFVVSAKNKAYAFMGKYGLTSYPFDSSLKYNKNCITVFCDSDLNLKYVLHKNKKLFFPANYTEEKVQELYNSLLIEQDEHSPHRYIEKYEKLRGYTLLDVGAAEGIMGLETVDYISHAYLFECDPLWTEALDATFSPWREKVTIIRKYVSDIDDENSLSLSKFCKENHVSNFFLKMDIEGAESFALKGAESILKDESNSFISIATYHRREDAEVIPAFLENLGYKTCFTDGYLFWSKMMNKAILRASK